MARNKIYKGALVAPNSKLYELMEQAERTKKPEDQRKVDQHAREVDLLFLKQCGLPFNYQFIAYAIGKEP